MLNNITEEIPDVVSMTAAGRGWVPGSMRLEVRNPARMPHPPEPEFLASPRANLRKLLSSLLEKDADSLPEDQVKQHVQMLSLADAENKLRHKKLYLVLDMDETLIYSQRLERVSHPTGHLIRVHGIEFDLVVRPGLEQFLEMMAPMFTMYLYTMGDSEYTRAVLKVIDPDDKFFTGGICCWHQHESRAKKSLSRVVCQKSMALVVDDSPEVWGSDLPNLCPIRRFTGDTRDDALSRLGTLLQKVHSRFYCSSSAVLSFDDPLGAPPDVRLVLSELRGHVLSGCAIAYTGVVSEHMNESSLPLSTLVVDFGGTVVPSVDEATHLVARQKPGWKQSAKLRRGKQRLQAEPAGHFSMVWDHWLLDTLCSWTRRDESAYAVPLLELRNSSAAGALASRTQATDSSSADAPCAADGTKSIILELVTNSAAVESEPVTDKAVAISQTDTQLRKRSREVLEAPRMAGAVSQASARLSVAEYLKNRVTQATILPTSSASTAC